MQEEKEEVTKPVEHQQTNELPTLEDLLQSFTAEGVFQEKHKNLLRGFLTEASLKILDDLLSRLAGNSSAIGFVLSLTCNLIFEERFQVFEGEWSLMQRKLKSKTRSQKSQIEAEVVDLIEQLECKQEWF